MIPADRESLDDTLIVTMTAGQLYGLVSRAAKAAAEEAVCEILRHMDCGDTRQGDDDVLEGGEAIARALGVNRGTMYRYLREGRLGGAVRQIGGEKGKLVARRSDLYEATGKNGR